MTFDEDTTYNKSRKRPAEKPEKAEVEPPRIHDTTMNEEAQEEDQEFEEPQRPVDPPLEKNPHKRNYLGTRTYPRCGKIWGSIRESQRKKEDQILLWVCSSTM